MEKTRYNYKKGLAAMAVCYFIWGVQPLYYAIDRTVDNMFLLASRVVWAALICLAIVALQGKLKLLSAAFRDKQVMKREIPAALLLLADWTVYMFAVRGGKVMECSMGYYIMPLVMFAFGALVFHEKITRKHLYALVFIVIGIVLSAGGFGGFPYVALLLSLCFAVYSALKKTITTDSIVSTTLEILLMLPFAVVYIAVFRRGETGMAGLTFVRQLFLIGSGLVTGLPLVLFSYGVSFLPLSLLGILQYASPTLDLFCGMILGETMSGKKLISFVFIWVGVAIYMLCERSKNKTGT